MTSNNRSNPSPRNRARRRTFGRVRRLPSGRWQARYTDSDGAERTAPMTFETKTAADDWLTTQRADLLRGVWRSPDLGNETVADYMRRWVDQRTDLAASTRYGYGVTLDRWIDRDLWLPAPRGGKPITVNIGARQLNALTVAHVREWFAACHATQVRDKADRDARGVLSQRSRTVTAPIREWARANGYTVADTGRLSPTVVTAWKRAGRPAPPAGAPRDLDLSGQPAAVVVQAYRSLRACLNAAVDDGLIEASPGRLKGAGTFAADPRPTATVDEIRSLCEAMPARFAVAVDLAAWSALRAGELFALARRHVDLTAGTLTVERALIDVAGQPLRFGPPKTGSSLRTVNLPPSVVTRLRAHMDTYTGDGADALVFAHPDGAPVNRAQRTRMFNAARRTIGRPELRWHDLRHTGATLAARAGASVRELQHRLGHSTYDAAMRYQHASADRDRELAARLDSYAAALDNGTVHVLRAV